MSDQWSEIYTELEKVRHLSTIGDAKVSLKVNQDPKTLAIEFVVSATNFRNTDDCPLEIANNKETDKVISELRREDNTM